MQPIAEVHDRMLRPSERTASGALQMLRRFLFLFLFYFHQVNGDAVLAP
jgi:hypothetical protein